MTVYCEAERRVWANLGSWLQIDYHNICVLLDTVEQDLFSVGRYVEVVDARGGRG
jgi:hypothetical protein